MESRLSVWSGEKSPVLLHLEKEEILVRPYLQVVSRVMLSKKQYLARIWGRGMLGEEF